ncbi:MAG: carboxypeptidase-like regulatory domain-containing protein [Bacteroidetes bacterium]|nr:carboxypeptidase-like regulatory domain-containing protein [Bacteroidota bacterium]
MNYRILFFTFFILLSSIANAQLYKLSGTVLDDKKEHLALASVEIKELQRGLLSKDDGSFEFYLERGKYTLVVSMTGYKPLVRTVYINNNDVTETVIMEENEAATLGEVIVKAKSRDRAEELIRNVVRIKNSILDAIGSYSYNAYIKAFQLDSGINKKKLSDTALITPDYSGMALSEIAVHVDKNENGQIKEERIGVSKRGNTEGLFYLTVTDGDFYLYGNLINTPPVSKIPFISPLSNAGLLAYKFKTLKIDRTIAPKVYTISIRPKQLSNAVIEGEIKIQDSTWNVISANYRLPAAHMPGYDYMEVKQDYQKVGDSARMISRQQFLYYTKSKNGRLYGETTVDYTNYELKKDFKKGYFGNEVSTTTVQAYEKDSSFWQSVRTVPLSVQQSLYVKYQDSIYAYQHSEAYLDSMDRVLNKITWKKMLIFGQIFNDHRKERMWILPPLTSLIMPISFGGARLHLAGAYRKTFTDKKTLSVEADLSYGFRNKDVNGMVSVSRMYNPFNRGKFKISAGRNFEFIYSGDSWVNVLKRSNIYLNNQIEVEHELQIINGVHLMNTVQVALRRSVAHYKVGTNTNSVFGIKNEPAIDFDPYNATYNEVKLYLTPKLKYIRDAREKIFLGSKWPTFYTIWRKGLPKIFNSAINFDYLEFGLEQNIKFGVAGNTSYIIKSGDFLNTKDLRVIDYKFMRRGDPLLFQNPQKAFQALDSTFPVFKRYYQGNLVHEFNGFLINKIPFMKKLKVQEIAGGGFLLAPERNLRYMEFFAGLERVFKWPFNPLARIKLGAYVVGSVANKFNNPVQFKIGLTTWDRFRNNWR